LGRTVWTIFMLSSKNGFFVGGDKFCCVFCWI